MERLLFTLLLALISSVLCQVMGRNRRQLKKVPKDMVILCQLPGKRYVLYALGIVVVGVVLFFGALYLMDGAPEDARPMWILCIAVALLTLFITILGGNMMAEECVYFGDEKIQINRAFREPQTYRWEEIKTIKGSFDQEVSLYLFDGTKVLTVNSGMLNYDVFCMVLKAKCRGGVTEYYRERVHEQPQKCVLRYGSEYYLLAMMGVLMLGVYLAILASDAGGMFLEGLLQSDPSEWFSLWFGPISGVIGIAALFIFCNTKVRYSPEGLLLQYPLRRKQEVSWRAIERIEVVLKKKQGKRFWKKLRLCTAEGTYKINLEFMTHGKDGFMTELFKAVDQYEIPCVETKK